VRLCAVNFVLTGGRVTKASATHSGGGCDRHTRHGLTAAHIDSWTFAALVIAAQDRLELPHQAALRLTWTDDAGEPSGISARHDAYSVSPWSMSAGDPCLVTCDAELREALHYALDFQQESLVLAVSLVLPARRPSGSQPGKWCGIMGQVSLTAACACRCRGSRRGKLQHFLDWEDEHVSFSEVRIRSKFGHDTGASSCVHTAGLIRTLVTLPRPSVPLSRSSIFTWAMNYVPWLDSPVQPCDSALCASTHIVQTQRANCSLPLHVVRQTSQCSAQYALAALEVSGLPVVCPRRVPGRAYALLPVRSIAAEDMFEY
jgi:hypothetical protein